MSIFGFFRKKTKAAQDKKQNEEANAAIKATDQSKVKIASKGMIKDAIGSQYLIEGITDGSVSIDRKSDGKVYEIWQGDSRETAIPFLRSIPVSKFHHLYYVIVETPDGNVGKDTDGIFDESTGRPIS